MAVLPIGISGEEGGYQIERSLRFNSADSAYLSRTPASAGNRKTWTWSGWVKRSDVAASGTLFAARTGVGATYLTVVMSSAGDFRMESNSETSYPLYKTNALFRDPSAWYHFVIALDMTQATSTNRLKVWVNGVLQTTASYNVPAQNTDLAVNSTETHLIGQQASGSYFNGYISEVNFIDGQALDPTSFGEYNSDTGVWQPKAYTGSYGTNGFYLDFADNSSTTALGYDAAGSNDWTPNNFSVTAGAGNDSLVDTPTLYGTDTGIGAEVRGNYATWNPLTNGSYTTLSNGNLQTFGNTSTNNGNTRGTVAFKTGKWYSEMTVTSTSSPIYPTLGIILTTNATSPDNGGTNQVGYPSNSVSYESTGSKRVANSTSAYGSTFTTGDVIGIAIDADNGAVYFSKNGTWQNSGVPTSGASKTGAAFTWTGGSLEYLIATAQYNGSGAVQNFGQLPFAYAAPTGFKALCTTNLPDPAIADGSTAFNTVLYTGNGSTQSITGVGFQPDWVWVKSRSAAYNNCKSDVVRGAGKELYSNLTNAETTFNIITSFDSDGFSVSTQGGAYNATNWSGQTYVAWNWKAGGTGVSNTDGTIASTVSANPTAGFSIVTYTGTGANATVGHGLGVAPSMVIVKNRADGTRNWLVYHKSVGATGSLFLDLTSATVSLSAYWNNTAPTSSVFSLGNSSAGNGSTNGMVAYCFAPVSGFSSAFSYTGNGSSDGPFIFTNFRVRWLMVKRTDSTGNWIIFDTSRNTYNLTNLRLFPNLSNAESSSTDTFDLLSNGFKARNTGGDINASGGTYVGMAFAENPFKYSLAR